MDANLDLLLVVASASRRLPAAPTRERLTPDHRRGDHHPVRRADGRGTPDERFLAVARQRLGHLLPHPPAREPFHNCRLRISGQIEALITEFP
jgi:hypothetical protein